MNLKPERVKDSHIIIYDEKHWRRLSTFRKKALKIMKILKKHNIDSLVIGSIARGDIHEKSDIDIIILNYIPSFIVENILISSGYQIFFKNLVQATPNSIVKANIYIDENTSISIPLSKLTEKDYEFFKFAGSLSLDGIIKNTRVPGINKKLLLIKPIKKGHIEYSIISREYNVAKILGISPRIIFEREKMLLRRDEIGRTGIFLKINVPPDKNIEDIARETAKKNPYLRKMINSLF
ncbi:MAG: nucleotidyltransferase domain-containing protein [Thermoproteales archaeon]|nr:nucleotidyltransferase domain-containing protein [Thermoproteales archaeon]